MRNIIDDVNNELNVAIPELKNIKDTSENVELVPGSKWDARIRSIFKSNLKKYGKALSPSGLSYYFRPCIIMQYLTDGETLIEINRKKYLLIRKYLMSEENHK